MDPPTPPRAPAPAGGMARVGRRGAPGDQQPSAASARSAGLEVGPLGVASAGPARACGPAAEAHRGQAERPRGRDVVVRAVADVGDPAAESKLPGARAQAKERRVGLGQSRPRPTATRRHTGRRSRPARDRRGSTRAGSRALPGESPRLEAGEGPRRSQDTASSGTASQGTRRAQRAAVARPAPRGSGASARAGSARSDPAAGMRPVGVVKLRRDSGLARTRRGPRRARRAHARAADVSSIRQ